MLCSVLDIEYMPRGSVVKNLSASAGDTGDVGLIPGSGGSPGGGNGTPLQYSCLGNPMDRESCWAAVQGVAKNWTLFGNWACRHPCTHMFSTCWLLWNTEKIASLKFLSKNSLNNYCVLSFERFCSLIYILNNYSLSLLLKINQRSYQL